MFIKVRQSVFICYWLFLSWQLFTPTILVRAGNFDKIIHLGAFFVLAVLALNARVRHVLYVLIVYAALTEIVQYYIPGRSFSVLDWVADCLGLLMGWWFYHRYQPFWQTI